MFLKMEEWGKLEPYFPISIVNIQYSLLSIFRITSLSRWNGAGRGLVRGGNRGWVASFFSAFLFGNFSFFFCVSSDSLGFQFVSFSQFLWDRGKWQWFSPFFTSSYLRICYPIRSPPTKRYKPGLVISLYQDAQCSKFTHNHHNKVKQGGCVSAEKHKSVHSYYIWICLHSSYYSINDWGNLNVCLHKNAASCQLFFMSLEIRLKISPKSDSWLLW